MKPAWSQRADDAELEALQTDVMRFIAILGLCLAAIFSLVHSAAQEEIVLQPGADESLVAEALVQAPVPVPVLAPVQQPESEPVATTTPMAAPQQEPGFSLEFASGRALMDLLANGKLQLYARVEGSFLVLDSSGDGFSIAAAPGSYYAMLTDTVPAALRRKLVRTRGSSADEWGVQLTADMVEQLQKIMRERPGGTLLIQSDGGIRVETEQ